MITVLLLSFAAILILTPIITFCTQAILLKYKYRSHMTGCDFILLNTLQSRVCSQS